MTLIKITMLNNTLLKIEPEKRQESLKRLIQEASPRRTFFLMTILSTALATLGLLIENIPVVIGAMLVAPLLSPVLCIGMGVVIIDFKLIKFSLASLLKAVILSILIAIIFSFLVGAHGISGTSIYQITPSYIFIFIALISGLAAALAWGHPGLSEALPGVAISVALIPPLAAVGIGISTFEWEIIRNYFQLFLINLICIILVSILVFHLMGYYKERRSAEKVIKKEEKILKEE
jgi:uncharacterized hydrophobic protein (TIGR00271 family)